MIKKLGMLLMLVSSLMLSAGEKWIYWECWPDKCSIYQCPVGTAVIDRFSCPDTEEDWDMNLKHAKKKADDLKKENVVWFALTGGCYGCSYNKLGTPIAVKLAEVLKENEILTFLDLDSNDIGDDGAKELAAALKENSTLTQLELSANNIGYDGAKALAEALNKNRTLTHLDLTSNNIDDEGAMALAKASKKNDTLNGILLDNNTLINKSKFKAYPKIHFFE